ncbi:5'-methylthioadenosine/adenosylhomocysteine nucleosidase [Clostridium isatidis]|uniref:5'-methylthioadenosine/adenosylhomocysteine nucleosidase n=1 Tax=Clostridium isatidis TaxID=182773 RepID=UPI003AAC726E
MTFGIISAMTEELELLLKEMNIEEKITKANMTFYKGTLGDKNIIAVVCGIGKVNAAICSQILISEYKVSSIINVGVAGGIGKDIYPGDVVIGTDLVEHDMDTSAFGDPVGQIPRLDTFSFKCDENLVKAALNAANEIKEINSFTGRIVSGDQFIANIDKIKWLSETFDAISCEMEGASIAHVCYLNNIPCVVIRSISDNANNGAHMDYEKFMPIAIRNSTTILKNMLKTL